jgi:pyruvate formate lyase activating enzyme
MKQAMFYTRNNDESLSCGLCNHACRIKPGARGLCRVRENRQGTLYALNYAGIIAAQIDPIEKKPFFHFLPGSRVFSIACPGCNFQCSFCQNWQISQAGEAEKLGIETQEIPPSRIVESALASGCAGIAYTYTEPTIFFEYAYDCAKLASERKLHNSFVTNGYMGREPLKAIAPYLSAANVDIKSFSENFYQKICKARLKPVLDNVVLMKRLNIWVEVTTLIVPGENDDLKELAALAGFIASVDNGIPWHISRFHPDYKLMDKKATEQDILLKAYDIGKGAGLKYVYLGNIDAGDKENTYCPGCNKLLIERQGYQVKQVKIKIGQCPDCLTKIEGIWN